jgi:hypothetical protein
VNCQSAAAGGWLEPHLPHAHSSPLHKNIADAAAEVRGGVRLSQASKEEPGTPTGLWLEPQERRLVGLHLLQLVVHIEPDPGR